MKIFDYQIPQDIKEAVALLEARGERARVIGGGTALFALMKERLVSPECLVELKGLSDLKFLLLADGDLRIGAMTTLTEIERSPVVRKGVPFLSEVVAKVASRRLRNQITLGGCLAYGETASDPPAACLALDASVRAVRKGHSRTLEVKDLFVDQYETCLKAGEVISEITIPKPKENSIFGHYKFTPRSKADKPTLGIAVRLDPAPDGRSCTDARVAFSNAARTPMRSAAAERALCGRPLDEGAFGAAAEAAWGEVNPPDDVYCTGAYKREMVRVLLPRLLRQVAAGRSSGRL
ncbi:MAG: xanthine dehydrogenase family protein subunit M [Candidatus Tectomicrobia bacterium]|nr:xanthine dehydrogenase family protein subunit M [Candidatus Tectomicrobia bacterium]